MFLFKKKFKRPSIDFALKNFLSYLQAKRDDYADELSHEYTFEERYEFIYNCALNTIDEYIVHRTNCNSLFLTSRI